MTRLLTIFSVALMLTITAFVGGTERSLLGDYRAADGCRREGLGLACIAHSLYGAERHSIPASQTITLSDGEVRSYVLLPVQRPGPRPTVIILHGVYGNGPETAAGSGLDALASKYGFVAVFPSARAGLWNAFPSGKVPDSVRLRAGSKGIGNDVLFLRELIAELVRRNIADPKRIFLSGLSMGGFMALDMACSDAADLAAVALVGSSMPEVTGETCSPTRPVALLIINGTADKTVPYAGGAVGTSHYDVWSTDRTLNFFRRVDGCDERESAADLAPLHPGQKTRVRVHEWSSCTRGRVTLYRIEAGEHEFPPIGLDALSVMTSFFDAIR